MELINSFSLLYTTKQKSMFTCDELRLLRASRRMKQPELAKKMNISTQRFSQLENNDDLTSERINEILAALGYTKETARKYLDSIPPPPKLRIVKSN
jgi:transcriptional regulator with XRE-family HTH domain